MPFLSMERIWPLGRMLALPPPLSDTVLPGGVRPAVRVEAGLAVVPPGFPVVDPVLPVVPGFAFAAGFPVVADFPVVAVRELVPGRLVDALPGLLVVPGFPVVVEWPAVLAWLCVVECEGAEALGAVCAGAAGLEGAGGLFFCWLSAMVGTHIKIRNSIAHCSLLPNPNVELIAAS
jgi:hypothetical protein